MNGVIERHAVPVLQFSGGKDSLACLLLLRQWWPALTVAWVNTGDAFPETLDLMARVRPLVGRFVEIPSDAPAQISRYGWPVDVVPAANTVPGVVIEGQSAQLMQPYWACCGDNIFFPMARAMVEIGASLIIRGQRASDARKGPLRSGEVVDGIEYWYPIEDWSDDDVTAYLRQSDFPLPPHYASVVSCSSLDCRHCTGWLRDSAQKLAWMRTAHPELHAVVSGRLHVVGDIIADELRVIADCCR